MHNDYDDEFFINDDELAQDHQLTLLDEAKMKVLKYIEDLVPEMKSNLEFSELGNYQSNLQILSSQISILIELESADENLSEEEMEELIDATFKKTTELTYANLDDIIPDDEDSYSLAGQNDQDEEDEDGTDF